ncbi:MAG: hypothetical protein HYU66_05205 [Armatimonadetes bacterium]|nr:hypothetical protein [Armatimonadota bacterium]
MGALCPERLAEWLGISAGGALVCEWDGRLKWLWVGGIAILVVAGLAAGISGDNRWLLVPLVVNLVALGRHLVVWSRAGDRVTAELSGVTVRARGRDTHYDWSQVRGVVTTRSHLLVRTTAGSFLVPTHGRNAHVLGEALKRVVAARSSADEEQGGPRDRLTGDEPIAERGIGRTNRP